MIAEIFTNIEQALNTEQNLTDAANIVRGAAVELAPVASGDLRGSIEMRVYTDDDGVHTADVYTRKQYAPYVEFGTGPKGMANHDGISPHVSPVYSPQPWWIHESQLEPGTGEKYGWHHIDTKDGRFYICYGQPAQPFLYPALKNNEQAVLDTLKDGLMEAIRRATR